MPTPKAIPTGNARARNQIHVDVESDFKKRIKVQADKKMLPVTYYIRQAILAQLKFDEAAGE